MLYPEAVLSFPGRDSLKAFDREVTCETVFGKIYDILGTRDQLGIRRQCYSSLAVK